MKLALLEDDPALLDRLDLGLLSEIKRGSNGTLELKLVNRLAALELMAKLMDAGDQSGTAEGLLRAMDEAAGHLGGDSG